MVKGGFEFDGEKEIAKVDLEEIQKVIDHIKKDNVANIVVSGVFSPVNHSQETQVTYLCNL